jgi:aminomethyltransferase
MKTLEQPISAKFNSEHGARTADFNGWQMPTFYTSIMEEYQAVRNSIGLFDVSHMGRWWAEGKDAQKFLDYISTNDISGLIQGKGVYTLVLNEDAGIIDDLIIYKFNDTKFLVVNNAGNHEAISKWFRLQSKNFDLKLKDITREIGQIAVQGPQAKPSLEKLLGFGALKYFNCAEVNYLGKTLVIAATGYTGEKGYEIYGEPGLLMQIWDKLIQDYSALACGLGSRDLLRLEAGYCLHGNDIDLNSSPFEAGLDWVCKIDKENFIGKDKCQRYDKKLVGLAFDAGVKIIPRSHLKVQLDGKDIGEITSGNYSPRLERGIALAYIDSKIESSIVSVQIRDKVFEAKVLQPWFYRNIRTPEIQDIK